MDQEPDVWKGRVVRVQVCDCHRKQVLDFRALPLKQMSTPTSFGRLLSELRGSTTQTELAERLYCSRSLVANIETGRSWPSQDFFARVKAVFPDHEAALNQAYDDLPQRPKRRGSVPEADVLVQKRIDFAIRAGRSVEAKELIEHELKVASTAVQWLWLIKRLAELALRNGDEAGAFEAARRGIAVAAERRLPGWETSLRDWLSLRLVDVGRMADAHEVLDEGLARGLEAGPLWRTKAIVYWYSHDYPAAYACVMTAEAHGSEAEFTRGQILAEWGHYPGAIADLTHVIEDSTRSAIDRASARVGRALAYCRLGDVERALDEFAEAERVTPEDAWLYYHRATCYLIQGRRDLALADIKTAIAAGHPLNPPKKTRALELIEMLESDEVEELAVPEIATERHGR